MLFKKTLLAATLLALAGVSATAAATTTTGTFTVQLTILKACLVTTSGASNINLGSVNAGTTTTNTSGTFTVACSNSTPYYIGLSPNSNASGTTGAGTLKGQTTGNTATIAYQLYQNSGATTVWGNTATTSSAGNGESGAGAGILATPTTFTAWANATGSTDVQPDTYKDTVTINVNF